MDYSVKCIYGKVKNARATVSVPGSKSITARALLIAALAGMAFMFIMVVMLVIATCNAGVI